MTSTLDEIARRRREEHLAAVAGRADPGAEVDVLADVALLRQVRRARVQTHAHDDRAARQFDLRLFCSGTAPAAVGNAMKNASPCVSTSTPP